MTDPTNVHQVGSSAPPEGDAPQPARLGVLAGGHYWLVRLDEAQEVLAVSAIAPVPLTKSWFRGIVNVRGNLYSVVDLARFALGQSATISGDARLVVLADRFRVSAALLVEKMLGLRTLQTLQPDTSEVSDDNDRRAQSFPWAQVRWLDADGRAWREISVADLVRHNDFLQAGL